MRVRNAEPGDGDALSRIWMEHARYYFTRFPADFRVPDPEGLADHLEEALARPTENGRLWLVAELEGELAGQLAAHLEPPVENAHRQMLRHVTTTRLFIDSVGTADAYQRRGVATALVEEAERWGRERGAAVAILDTYARSELSMPFWEKRMGYVPHSIIFSKQLS